MSQRAFVVAALLVTLVGCDKIGEPKPKVAKVVVTGIDSLYAGATKRFTVSLTYDGEAPSETPPVEWSSSEPDKASVDAEGNVTGLVPSIGSNGLYAVTITARVLGVGGSAALNVLATPGFVLFPDSAAMVVGTMKTIAAYNARSYYIRRAINPQSWSTDRPDVATVDGAGQVTAVSPGKAIITARYEANGGSFTLQSTVIVVAPLNMNFTAASGGPFVEDYMASGIYARFDRNCGLGSDEAIYCWSLIAPGITPYDQCDVTFTQGHYVPSQCSSIPARLPINAKFVAVSMGAGGGGCGLTSSGEIYCFGLNYAGQLGVAPKLVVYGDGSTGSAEIGAHRFLDHEATRLPSAEPFRAVFAASDLRCAIQQNDIGVCWGNGLGEKPVQLSTFGWNTIAERGSCGIISDSTAVCFTIADKRPSLFSVPLPYHLTHIDVSDGAICALASTGEIACWQSGGSPTTIANTPKLVSLGNMPSSVTFHSKTCGLTSAGDTYCIVVAGTTTSRTYSLQSLDLGVKLKSFSGNCGVGLDDKVYCWKWNSAKAVLVPGQ